MRAIILKRSVGDVAPVEAHCRRLFHHYDILGDGAGGRGTWLRGWVDTESFASGQCAYATRGRSRRIVDRHGSRACIRQKRIRHGRGDCRGADVRRGQRCQSSPEIPLNLRLLRGIRGAEELRALNRKCEGTTATAAAASRAAAGAALRRRKKE